MKMTHNISIRSQAHYGHCYSKFPYKLISIPWYLIFTCNNIPQVLFRKGKSSFTSPFIIVLTFSFIIRNTNQRNLYRFKTLHDDNMKILIAFARKMCERKKNHSIPISRERYRLPWLRLESHSLCFCFHSITFPIIFPHKTTNSENKLQN
jgi:hypothetical protein